MTLKAIPKLNSLIKKRLLGVLVPNKGIASDLEKVSGYA